MTPPPNPRAAHLTNVLGLTPWRQVHRRWNEEHPDDPLTLNAVHQIGRDVDRQLREALADLEAEWFGGERAA